MFGDFFSCGKSSEITGVTALFGRYARMKTDYAAKAAAGRGGMVLKQKFVSYILDISVLRY